MMRVAFHLIALHHCHEHVPAARFRRARLRAGQNPRRGYQGRALRHGNLVELEEVVLLEESRRCWRNDRPILSAPPGHSRREQVPYVVVACNLPVRIKSDRMSCANLD